MRGEGREEGKERKIHVPEKHQPVVSHLLPEAELVHSSGMCPNWESIWWPFGLQQDTQLSEPHQSWLVVHYF